MRSICGTAASPAGERLPELAHWLESVGHKPPASDDELQELGSRLLTLCEEHEALLMISRRSDLARRVQAPS